MSLKSQSEKRNEAIYPVDISHEPMRTLTSIFLFLIAIVPLWANSNLVKIRPITESEAASIVRVQEEAREQAKDEKEAQLRNKSILGTAVADVGQKKVFLNRVPQTYALKAPGNQTEQIHAALDEAALFEASSKEKVNFALSGTVRDGISELWWRLGEDNFKIYTNANFLYLSGWINDLEDENTIYSVFPIINEGSARAIPLDGEWRPNHDDFTSGQLEYIIVNSSDDESINTQALKPIELMLVRYVENFDQLKIIYENGQKMSAARTAYLKVNPPKKRDTIINFAPIDKNARNAVAN